MLSLTIKTCYDIDFDNCSVIVYPCFKKDLDEIYIYCFYNNCPQEIKARWVNCYNKLKR